MTSSFLTQFTYRQEPENATIQQLLPMPQTITVDYTSGYFAILEFADAIQSRIGQGLPSDNMTRLQTVEIHSTVESVLDPTVMSRLRQLRETGLKISVLFRDRYIL